MYVSAASLNHWGYTPEELIGKSYHDLILEEDLLKTNGIIESINNGSEIQSFLNRYKKKDGGIAYNFWSARWDNTTKLRYAVARDGSEKIAQEEAMLQSERRFKALVQEGSDLIAILDTEGNYLYVSPTSSSILGVSPEDFFGRNALEYIHPDDLERTLTSLGKIATTNRVIVAPFRFQNHKKEWRWMESVLTNMLDNPAVHGIVANSRDITAKIEEEHKLKLFESVVTNTNDAVLITEAEPFDKSGPRIIFVNEAFTKMTGYSTEEIIGKTPKILQGPNSDKEELAKLGLAIRNWETHEITTINYKKNGEEFWINFTVTPVANEEGKYTHWIAIERDVTEQKTNELEKELIAQISINFNTENDLTSASNELCKSISKIGDFDWVELWTTNLDKSQMQFFSHYVAAPTDEKFYDDSPEFIAFKRSEGLSGKVWTEGVQLLWDDVEKSKDFIRRDAAKKIGLKSAMGIPLIYNDEVIGILHVGSKHDSSYLKNYALIFQRLEGFIGLMLNRKKLENDLRNLFKAIPDIICLVDFQGKFLKINKAGCDLLGYSQEELLYHTFDEFVHPNDKEIFSNQVKVLEKAENRFKFENRFITSSGDIVWLSWYCNSTLKEGLIYATAKNITEEKKLAELNRQARSIAKIGSWEVDLVNQSIFWSNEVHQMHGTDPKSFVPDLKGAINFYQEDFRQMVQVSISECIATGEPFDFEAVLVTATKKEIWVRAIGNPEFIEGECSRIYGSFQNINDRKESESRLLAISENLPGVILQYHIHPDGSDSIKYVSGEVQQLCGFTAKEIMENIRLLRIQIKLGGDFEEFKAIILESIQTKTKSMIRSKYVMPTGELRTHLTYGTPIFLADGTIVYNAIILDITEEVKNEELLRQASNLSRIGSWEMSLINQEDDRMYWSPMLFEILELDDNYNPTLTGGIEFHIGESKGRIQKVLDLLIKKGTEFDEEILLLTAKGNERWVRCIGKSELVNNKRIKIFGSYQDITKSKKAEENLRRSEETNRLIMTSALDAIICIDVAGNVTFWNPPAEKIFGWLSHEIMGQKLSDYIIPENFRSMHDKGMNHYLKTGEAKIFNQIMELSALNKNGELFPVELTIVPIKQGKEEFFCSFIRDITASKKAKESILQSNERFEKVTEATNDAIWDWDLEKHTYFRSKAVENFFGKETSGIFPEHEIWAKEHFHPEDLAQIKHSFYKAIADPLCNRWESEYRVINELGETLYVIDRAVILRDTMGKVTRVIGAMTDTSESKRMTLELSQLNKSLQKQTYELERSNEELEQFAFVASHDLQAPLRMISSFMDLLQRKYGDRIDEKGHQYIHFAIDGAKRMKQIILDLLEYSKASGLTEGKEEVDLNELLSEFKQLRRKVISETNASIKSKDLPVLYTYKVAVIQIFHCLLDNALKYIEAGTQPIVKIMAVENEKEWEFSIKDNGIGIEPQFYDKIFVLFQRLHNKDEYNGTGIGLSIAKKHVEFLGGRIWLESAVGEGTTFYFTIPKINLYEN